MIATPSRRRVRAAALLGGAAVFTVTAAGLAAASPGTPAETDHTIVVCTAPGEPPLEHGDGGHFSHTITIERGDVEVAPARPMAPGALPPLADGQCMRIEAGEHAPALTAPALPSRR
ncbi:hypothetical protein [Nocardia sp. SSK8]|uniref:hypothetical protein n=1 Tax=Nocardia sp. SSK8 TaxID=3120154 RepID=UPI00300A8038